jgi:hypothetical protein
LLVDIGACAESGTIMWPQSRVLLSKAHGIDVTR